ncbi:bifunctional nicotinamide-nucleotide adenylyltransferase/Nudix hydroxylase [Pseudoduganella namucuonensis]|uniref:Bifunctional NMN adenylyltransferase/nudix hydrolase n=1 Tax=Pseudoduganella namucuonensis TaxID=1035707 RepID=A0A1I7LVF0_9BURK|nr:bifunctional nicotinamide-nucleotide adenylyltransferase/Nudix hydroxylase [Pseudoduganella namucuonensis]SFV13622.1 bifunctional NMN adenylyltransferase/nudix hydrolase [Pseudoduganella namucuonensis]
MTDTRPDLQLAVLIGRFQPFHNGHAALLRKALASAPRAAIVLGSSFHARSAKNPFTADERAAMIGVTLSEEERGRVTFLPIRDYYDDQKWSAAVQLRVEALAGEGAQIALVGHFKDDSSYYLNHFPQWHLVAVARDDSADATALRRALFETEDMAVTLEAIASEVPLAVRHYLKAWTLLPHHARLAEEHAAIAKYKAEWARAPYPPIFSTVDAVVETAGHVLLVQRGAAPGKGLWAIPGGYLEQRERVLAGAIRELQEETGLSLLTSTLEDALEDVRVFDHPDRSQRGRTITHAHHFNLRLDHLPEVKGADDAALAAWVPVAQLASLEDRLYDDHFHILAHFLRLPE